MSKCEKVSTVKLAAFAGALAAFSAAAYAQPANNNCANAIELSGPGSVNGTTSGATLDGGTFGCVSTSPGGDVWYKYTNNTGSARQVTADTCASGTNFDTIIDARLGTCGGQILACNDDWSGCSSSTLRSRIQFTLQNGQTALIRIGGYGGATGNFTLNMALGDAPPPGNPDVIVFNLPSMAYFGQVSGINAYAVGTTSCNIGTTPLEWISGTNQHPVIGQAMYRLKDNKFEQIGISWLKHGFLSLNNSTPGCGTGTCQQPPNGGSQLGVHCTDPYDANLNGSQSRLGPRSQVNATTGNFPYPFTAPSAPATIGRRMQVRTVDVTPAQNVGARYYTDAMYVTFDDALAGNALNNCSWREINPNGPTGTPGMIGVTQRQQPAIFAWQVADASVRLVSADTTESGLTTRYWVGSKVVNNGNGTWTYIYAIYNINSDASGGSFTIPFSNVSVSGGSVGFSAPFYHSGEPYDNTPWVNTVSSNSIQWRTDRPFAQNPDANALRFHTMYTYWFTANTEPTTGSATIGLFKTGGTVGVNGIHVPSAGGCAADFNGDGQVDFFDYLDFVQAFNDEDPSADFNGDGQVDFFDYLDFVQAFDEGCE